MVPKLGFSAEMALQQDKSATPKVPKPSWAPFHLFWKLFGQWRRSEGQQTGTNQKNLDLICGFGLTQVAISFWILRVWLNKVRTSTPMECGSLMLRENDHERFWLLYWDSDSRYHRVPTAQVLMLSSWVSWFHWDTDRHDRKWRELKWATVKRSSTRFYIKPELLWFHWKNET